MTPPLARKSGMVHEFAGAATRKAYPQVLDVRTPALSPTHPACLRGWNLIQPMKECAYRNGRTPLHSHLHR